MIDGIKVTTQLTDFESWRKHIKFPIHTAVDIDTGEIKNITLNTAVYEVVNYFGKYNTYDIKVKEVRRNESKTKFYLTLTGSLHKNFGKGNNCERFHSSDVKKEIKQIYSDLRINENSAKLTTIEVGVNLPVEFAPLLFLQDYLLFYKTTAFDSYRPNNRNIRLGFVNDNSQYEVKLYDKGLQYNLSHEMMRFELKFNVLQRLSKEFDITYLHDLTQQHKIVKLKKLLLQAWKDVLLFEPLNIDDVKLTKLQKHLIEYADNTRYWTKMYKTDKRKFHYHRKVLKGLIKKYGQGYHAQISKQINDEWDLLAQN